MFKVLLFKVKEEGVSTATFKKHMLEDRPPEIDSTPGIRGYELSFPTDPPDSQYDSYEAMYFESMDDMQEAFESEAADRAHEKGQGIINFGRERSVIVETALTAKF
ncbi:hypothetical protein ACLI4Q_17140 [Natrialbaceae archaeon A-CW1-1]